MAEKTLPFPRGQTASDSGLVDLDDSTFSDLEGKIFEVPDTEHGTGEAILLRAVKNDSGSDITVARKFMRFAINALDFGRRVAGVVNAAGAVCKPVDDAYAVGFVILDDDIFYVVERGKCGVLTESSAVALDAGAVVASDSSGFVNGTPCAQATEYAAGKIGPAAYATATEVVVDVQAGLGQIGT